jgi:hypothetical protein
MFQRGSTVLTVMQHHVSKIHNIFSINIMHKAHRCWDRLFSFPAAISSMLMAMIFWVCRDRITDPDLWWHLRNGQYITASWSLPSIDTYSFTAKGSEWLDHSWLPEVIYYGAYSAFGLIGVFTVFALAIITTCLGIFALCRMQTKDPFAAGVSAVYGILLAMVGFSPRAQNFGWLCFLAIFAVLLRFRNTRRSPLWLLPVLFCLWINCHGGWPIGFVVGAIFLMCGCVGQNLGPFTVEPWTSTERRKLVLALLASVVAVFLNPHGSRLVFYPFELMVQQKLMVTYSAEWASVDFNSGRSILVMVGLGAVLVMALMSRKRWRMDDLVLTLFVFLCGLKHLRLLMLTGIVLPTILAPHLGKISSYNPQQERRALNGLVVFVALASIIIGYPSLQLLQSEVDTGFPAEMIRYLDNHLQSGNMFNQYEWGGYLEWNLPHVPTFIDTRTDIFEYRGLLKDYFSICTLDHTEELLERYRISYVLYKTNTALSYFLSKSTKWECIYKDSQAVIYRRLQQANY